MQPIDWAHPGVSQAVHLPKLAEVEEQGELPGHGPQRQEGGQNLGQQEAEVDGVNGPFQGQDDNFLIGQEEEQHRQLEHERKDPEGCQLWHLMTGGGWREGGTGGWTERVCEVRRCADRAVSRRQYAKAAASSQTESLSRAARPPVSDMASCASDRVSA